ncbi:MAG: extracellular solute-binding protein [Chloroflexi bacterium]|nr:extracellular solute-binding protein [Chloroflexota bacterium]
MASLGRSPASLGVLIVALLAAACAPAAQPSPAAAPAKPAEAAKPAAGAKPFAGRTLRVATWGGDWANGVKTSTAKIFEEQTGATVEYVFGNPADNLTRLLATRGEPPFDVMQLDNLTEGIMIDKGLLEPIDHAKLPVNEVFNEAANVTKDYGPAFTIIPGVIGWSPARFKELGVPAPKSFDDLFNPKLKGRVAYPGMRFGSAPLLISGLAWTWTGDKNAVGEAAKKLKQMEPRVFGATPEMATWLTNGEVYAGISHTAQIMVMKSQGFDLDYVYPQMKDKRGWVYWNMTDVIKGTKNKDMAEKWVQINLSGEAQELMGRSNGVLPTHKAVSEKFAKEEKLKVLALTPTDMAQMYQDDAKFINDNRDKWNDEWNRIMGS